MYFIPWRSASLVILSGLQVNDTGVLVDKKYWSSTYITHDFSKDVPKGGKFNPRIAEISFSTCTTPIKFVNPGGLK